MSGKKKNKKAKKHILELIDGQFLPGTNIAGAASDIDSNTQQLPDEQQAGMQLEQTRSEQEVHEYGSRNSSHHGGENHVHAFTNSQKMGIHVRGTPKDGVNVRGSPKDGSCTENTLNLESSVNVADTPKVGAVNREARPTELTKRNEPSTKARRTVAAKVQPPNRVNNSANLVNHSFSSTSNDCTLGSQDTNVLEETRTTILVGEENERKNKGEWRNLFKSNRSIDEGIKLSYIQVPIGKDVVMEKEDVQDNEEAYGYTLIGHIAGKSTGKLAIVQCCNNWKGKEKIIFHASGWIIIKFDSEASRSKVLEEGPYYIFGRPFILKPMPSCFNFDDHEIRNVPVWVQFPNLPLGLWNKNALSKIGSMVGIPLNSDKLTKTMERCDYARVLIEMDVTKQYPKSVTIKLPNGASFEQKVAYEYIPFFCGKCNAMGHTRDRCPRNTKTAPGQLPKRGNNVHKVFANEVDYVNPEKQVMKEAAGIHQVQRTTVASRNGQNASREAGNVQAKDTGTDVTKELSGQNKLLVQNFPEQHCFFGQRRSAVSGSGKGKKTVNVSTIHPVHRKDVPRAAGTVHTKTGTAIAPKKQSGQNNKEMEVLLDQRTPEQRCRDNLNEAIRDVQEFEQIANDSVNDQRTLNSKRRHRDELEAAIKSIEDLVAACRIAEQEEGIMGPRLTLAVPVQKPKAKKHRQHSQSVVAQGSGQHTVAKKQHFAPPIGSKFAVLSGIAEDWVSSDESVEVEKDPRPPKLKKGMQVRSNKVTVMGL